MAENLGDLSIDIAKSSGEFLDGLAEIAQISGQDKERFFRKLKTNFDTIFPSGKLDYKYTTIEIKVIIKEVFFLEAEKSGFNGPAIKGEF